MLNFSPKTLTLECRKSSLSPDFNFCQHKAHKNDIIQHFKMNLLTSLQFVRGLSKWCERNLHSYWRDEERRRPPRRIDKPVRVVLRRWKISKSLATSDRRASGLSPDWFLCSGNRGARMMTCWVLVGVFVTIVLIYSFIEFHYFLRMFLTVFLARFCKKRVHILDETVIYGTWEIYIEF